MEYAIVIGIDHYDERPLAGAVGDADAFAGFLTDKKLINKDSNLKLLKSEINNSVAQGAEIDRAIEEIVKDARTHKTENNRLYFYFSGHGIANTYFNTALCLRYWSSTYINHCISFQDYLTGIINKGIFDEILVFLDCCREHDALVKGSSPIGDWQSKVGQRIPKIFVCNSAAYGKLSYETPIDSNQKRGAFTSFLIESLKGDADLSNTGQITVSDLKNHIDKNFETYATQNGKYQKAQADPSNGGETIVICQTEKLTTKHNCEITFKRTSNVTLKGRDAKDIKTDEVKDGDIWKVQLEQGFSVLVDNSANEKKIIENYSENTMSYVEF